MMAEKWNLTREEQDDFAFRSHQKAASAMDAGYFDRQILPLTLPDGQIFNTDEGVRRPPDRERMRALKPVFQDDGTVTAGNASGITDGAAALLMMSAEKAQELGLEVLAHLGHTTQAGVDPKVMGIGPVPAIRELCEKSGRGVNDYDLIEINEAFAAQVLACQKDLEFDMDKLNVNGGSIALGHPIGCTGARIVVTLLHEMKRRQVSSGLASLCISGGMGFAAEFTR